MNRQFNNTSRQSNNPFCIICKKAGKSHNHKPYDFPGEKATVVLCTVIKEKSCSYCKQTGHMMYCARDVVFCPVLKEKQKRQNEHLRRQKQLQMEQRRKKKALEQRQDNDGFTRQKQKHVKRCNNRDTKQRDNTAIALGNIFSSLSMEDENVCTKKRSVQQKKATSSSKGRTPAVVTPSKPALSGWNTIVKTEITPKASRIEPPKKPASPKETENENETNNSRFGTITFTDSWYDSDEDESY